jgi:leucyl-tRNA synthetase
MICVNELTEMKCSKRAILQPLNVLISSFAPHIAEELWSCLGHSESITIAGFPIFKEEFIQEDTFNYPVSFNGKLRFMLDLPIGINPQEVEAAVVAAQESQKWLNGNPPKKVIFVPKKIINVVV